MIDCKIGDHDRLLVARSVERAIARSIANATRGYAPELSVQEASFPAWGPLLHACGPYARLSGMRFLSFDFDLWRWPETPSSFTEALAARAAALPAILEFSQLLREATEHSALMVEFRHCQRLLAGDAAYQMMLKSCLALGFPREDTNVQVEPGDTAFQDVSEPLPVIAARLLNHAAAMELIEAADASSRRQLLQAAFIVDFGEAHGGQEKVLRDETSLAQLREFWQRVHEWGGVDEDSRAVVAALTGEAVGEGDAGEGVLSLTARERSMLKLTSLATRAQGVVRPAGMLVGAVTDAVDEEARLAIAYDECCALSMPWL